MKRYRILTLAAVFFALATMVAMRQSPVFAQQAAPAVKVATTTVTRVTLYKINPGQRAAFNQDVMTNLIPIYEEQIKAGILSSYSIFNNVTATNPNDWGVGISLSYPNYAALDTLAARSAPINLKHYGSAAKAAEIGQHRNDFRTVVSSRLQTELHYSQGPS